MPQGNRPKEEMKKLRERAAVLIAEGLKTYTEISDEVGIEPDTLWRWRKEKDFAARVKEIQDQVEESVADLFVANKRNRIALYNRQLAKLLSLEEERIKAYGDVPDVVGGKTGAIIVKKRVTRTIDQGKGKPPIVEETIEFAYDRNLDAELRELAKQAAIEKGEWSEKRELTGSEGSPLIPIREIVIDRSAE